MEKKEKRGRPPQVSTDYEQPVKFTREFKDHNGNRAVWTYDLKKYPNGPISVEFFYPPGFTSQVEVENKLPKTKRRYINPKTGKEVAYFRAVQLGLIKK